MQLCLQIADSFLLMSAEKPDAYYVFSLLFSDSRTPEVSPLLSAQQVHPVIGEKYAITLRNVSISVDVWADNKTTYLLTVFQ